ncbi:MAG: hypothetical protein LBK99_26095 [Opitutaceae bacterium]|jgi:L-alanine-DL-glutamate epimerase-like enolase superfamily enzyme|nr:hypothetical protein [Opitutaceae bacterium]
MSAGISIVNTSARVLPLRARMPFRFGISRVTRVPHVIVRVEVAVGGRRAAGVAADSLMPKWFTKNPHTGFRADIDELREAVLSGCEVARMAGRDGESVFALWHAVHGEQLRRGGARGWPHLLANFGASLIERALIDAVCRLHAMPFHAALVRNLFGVRLEKIYPELAGMGPAEVVPSVPVSRIRVRHTVGLSDPLTRGDLTAGEWPDDGLPVCLEDVIARHGIRRFKIKVSDDTEKNLVRLRAIAAVIGEALGDDHVFTLDGNESWRTPEAFEDFWRSASKDTVLRRWFRRLRFIEQPLHRDCALCGDGIRAMLARLQDAGPMPPVIIDESDAEVDTLARALAAGYAGTTHKNCKGVFKSVANLALLRHRGPALAGGGTGILSGEDLTNVGPVALPQDLCVTGALGIDDLERNGHHYFAGLRGFPEALSAPMARHHADVFARTKGEAGRGFLAVRIDGGRIGCASLHRQAGLGPVELADVAALPSLEDDADWAAVVAALEASPDED